MRVRVLFLSPVGVVGGAERCLLDMVASLRACAPEVEVGVLVGTEGPLAERVAELGAESIRLPMPEELAAVGDSGLRGQGRLHAGLRLARVLGTSGLALAWYLAKLGRAVAGFDPTVIHSNGIKTHLLAAVLPERARLVWHVHDFLSERPAAWRALRALVSRADLAIANSGAVAEDTRAVLGRLPVEVLLNAVDTARFSPAEGDGARLDRLAGMPPAAPGTVRVGLVATYARWKGQDVFIGAAAELRRRAPEVPFRFYIVGGPLYRTQGSQFSEAELMVLARSRGVEREVGLVPFQEDVAEVYRALDVVVHASTRREPFGLTIAEAMACGRAVVASRAGGAGELFEPGREAVGLESVTPSSLAEAIERLARDAALRAALGRAAREAAVARLARERLGPALVALYGRAGGAGG